MSILDMALVSCVWMVAQIGAQKPRKDQDPKTRGIPETLVGRILMYYNTVYHILYTLYCILFTIYIYILYTVSFWLFTIYCCNKSALCTIYYLLLPIYSTI